MKGQKTFQIDSTEQNREVSSESSTLCIFVYTSGTAVTLIMGIWGIAIMMHLWVIDFI